MNPELILEKGLTENIGIRDWGLGMSQPLDLLKESIVAPLTGDGGQGRFSICPKGAEIVRSIVM